MKVKARTTTPKTRGAKDTKAATMTASSAAARIEFGLSNRDISTKKEELLKDNKKSKKETLAILQDKIVNLFTSHKVNSAEALVSIFKKDSIVRTDLGFRFMPDAFETFRSFKGTIYAVNAFGIPYAYNIELTEEQTSAKDANNKKMIMNFIHSGSYILGVTAFGFNKEMEPKNVCMLFSIPFYNENVNKKHFVINMLNYLKDLNKNSYVFTSGTMALDISVVPKNVCDWVDNSEAPIKVLASKRIDDMYHETLYHQLVSTDSLDDYALKMLGRIQYSTFTDKYKVSFVPEARDGQLRKMCFLFWDTKCNRFLTSHTSGIGEGKRALRLGMAYSIVDKITGKVAKQAMFKFTDEHKDFINSIVINSETFDLTINDVCNRIK